MPMATTVPLSPTPATMPKCISIATQIARRKPSSMVQRHDHFEVAGTEWETATRLVAWELGRLDGKLGGAERETTTSSVARSRRRR